LVYDEKAEPGQGKAEAPRSWKMSARSVHTASGNVKIVQNERMAVAGKALYDNAKRTITLTEGPRLWQGADVMVAKTIIVYLDENRVDSQGGDENPIKFKINPEQQKKEKEK
jgi:lipopolysaccharide export system protein LptA